MSKKEVSKKKVEEEEEEEEEDDGPTFPLADMLGVSSIEEHYSCTPSSFSVPGYNSKQKIASWVWKTKKPPRPDQVTAPKTIIGLHGGPAFCHNYILPLIKLCDWGHTVILYDQCGCGDSPIVGSPKDIPPHLLTVKYYIDELASCVKHHQAECSNGYVLFGSSWGGMLALEYAVFQPYFEGLQGLILDGALADSQLYIKTQWRDVLSKVPTLTQQRLKTLEEAKAFESEEYECIEEALSVQFTSRLLPPAQCYVDSLNKQNHDIYVKMQGPSEFSNGGVLEFWDITPRLSLVRTPTLVVRGEFDTMTEECCQQIIDFIPSGLARPLVTIPRAAHCKLCDEPILCAEVMASFLNEF